MIETLENRALLSGMPPMAMSDSYSVAFDTFSSSGQSKPSVLANDMDMEMDSLTASLVGNVSHGTLSLSSNGHFTYTPDTGYFGSDSFTYQAYDGTGYSSSATVTLSVSTTFTAPTILEDLPAAAAQDLGGFGVSLQTGGVETSIAVAPGHSLVYSSMTEPYPIIGVDATLYVDFMTGAPSAIVVDTSFNGGSAHTMHYEVGGMALTAATRLADQFDATALDTGRYEYEIEVVATFTGSYTSTRTYTGHTAIINRNESVFGDNWSLAELDRLYIVENVGVLHVTGTNIASWFEDNLDGSFNSPPGPMHFVELVQNLDDSYTLTDKFGNRLEFDEFGLLTARVDRNNNEMTYEYTDADGDSEDDDIALITDAFGRETLFDYDGGLLLTVTDFAGRVTTLDHDVDGHLTLVVAPDPDGIGGEESPETAFGYDGSQLVLITDALSHSTEIEYDFAGRFAEATYADASVIEVQPWQIRALIDPGSGEGTALNPADLYNTSMPSITMLDTMSQPRNFGLDRFGNVTWTVDALSHGTGYGPFGAVDYAAFCRVCEDTCRWTVIRGGVRV